MITEVEKAVFNRKGISLEMLDTFKDNATLYYEVKDGIVAIVPVGGYNMFFVEGVELKWSYSLTRACVHELVNYSSDKPLFSILDKEEDTSDIIKFANKLNIGISLVREENYNILVWDKGE